MAMSLPEMWILRHGETEWNVEGRLQGHLDSPLTETGLRQARAQGAILETCLPEGVSVLSSPSGRAWETARIAVAGLGLEVVAEPDLREIDMGEWHGELISDLAARLPEDMTEDPHLWKFTAPGGERLEQMEARLSRLLARLAGPTVMVTHGVTSRALRCLALGLPLERMGEVPGGQGVVHHVKDGVATVIAGQGRIRG